ncbi:MAG: anti-sigma factor [Candidatus Tectomicrobia bacterium]|uniref:Anti-sigma factor n=1 Tax=Tectimicrobiota bacterium TaxID=2528274 RepID=A0A938B374_UNCTE|nr:anti-sigma factor [Candidatus Tectomicrobia bacterium]
MLSCQDCERYLSVFLDHALEVKESLDVEAHLQGCLPCAHRAESEQRFRSVVRQSLTVPPPPEELKRMIIRRAMQEARPPGWRSYFPFPARLRDFALGMATAAILAFVVYGTLPDFSADQDIQKVTREASLAYGTYTRQHMPLDMVSADDAAVVQWLSTRMGYRIKMPCVTDGSTQLLGGRVCRLLDRKSAALMYQRHGVPILVFAFHGEHLSIPPQTNTLLNGQTSVHVRHVSGRPVATWQRDGVVYSMVGDVHRDELMSMAASMNYR